MARMRFLVLFLAPFLLCSTAYAGLFSSSETVWHYRMTVTVETPEGIKTGSAVREVVYRGETHGGGGPGLDLKVHGEAVVVDLGQRGVLFGLLTGETLGHDYGSDILLYAFEKGRGLDPASVPEQGKVTLSPEQYPEFIRYKVANDPTSVEVVHDKSYPPRGFLRGETVSTFEEAFGKGVHLKDVTIEMTAEPVTHGVVQKFAPPLTAYNNNGPFWIWLRTLKYGDPRGFGPDMLY